MNQVIDESGYLRKPVFGPRQVDIHHRCLAPGLIPKKQHKLTIREAGLGNECRHVRNADAATNRSINSFCVVGFEVAAYPDTVQTVLRVKQPFILRRIRIPKTSSNCATQRPGTAQVCRVGLHNSATRKSPDLWELARGLRDSRHGDPHSQSIRRFFHPYGPQRVARNGCRAAHLGGLPGSPG